MTAQVPCSCLHPWLLGASGCLRRDFQVEDDSEENMEYLKYRWSSHVVLSCTIVQDGLPSAVSANEPPPPGLRFSHGVSVIQ